LELLNLASVETYEGAQSVKANLDNRKSFDPTVKGCSNDTIAWAAEGCRRLACWPGWLGGLELLNLASVDTYKGVKSVKANLINRKSLGPIVKGCSNDTIAWAAEGCRRLARWPGWLGELELLNLAGVGTHRKRRGEARLSLRKSAFRSLL
jgi:hypothetical protein